MDSSPIDWIETKKRGGSHSPETLRSIVGAVSAGTVPDYQLAAWLMAVWQRGLDADEMVWLTGAMRDSGVVLRHPAALEPTADKHSTGGIGDKASLVVAPLAAELGLRVPMLSGRGLGHTGGTLDKLQAIAGYRVDLDPARFEKVLEDVGCSIIGQTAEIAPADRRLYALRDVTGTVDCIGLIVCSILSKKLAAGPSHLVIDLKCGSGAFMSDLASARELGHALVGTAASCGLPTSALITDMSQPLGQAVGHALEVEEALACLRGGGPADLRELCIELTAEMGRLCGMGEASQLRMRCAGHLDDGSAATRFARMVEAHGGAPDFEDRLEIAAEAAPLVAPRAGVVTRVQADELGRAVIELGGGRVRHEDEIDLSVGLRWLVRVGAVVEEGQPLIAIFCADEARVARARERMAAAITVSADAVSTSTPVVLERLEA